MPRDLLMLSPYTTAMLYEGVGVFGGSVFKSYVAGPDENARRAVDGENVGSPCPMSHVSSSDDIKA